LERDRLLGGHRLATRPSANVDHSAYQLSRSPAVIRDAMYRHSPTLGMPAAGLANRALQLAVEAIFVKIQLHELTLFVEVVAPQWRSALGRAQDGSFARS